MEEYISIAEYARLKGISKQAVYQQLNKRLKPFVETVDGKKVLSIKALEDITVKPIESTSLEALVKQLEAKDKQIEALTNTIASLTDSLRAEQALHADTKQQLRLLTVTSEEAEEEAGEDDETRSNETNQDQGSELEQEQEQKPQDTRPGEKEPLSFRQAIRLWWSGRKQ